MVFFLKRNGVCQVLRSFFVICKTRIPLFLEKNRSKNLFYLKNFIFNLKNNYPPIKNKVSLVVIASVFGDASGPLSTDDDGFLARVGTKVGGVVARRFVFCVVIVEAWCSICGMGQLLIHFGVSWLVFSVGNTVRRLRGVGVVMVVLGVVAGSFV